MTAIRHMDTGALKRRQIELRAELALVEAELSRRDSVARQTQQSERDAWVKLNPVGRQLLPLTGGAFDRFPNA